MNEKQLKSIKFYYLLELYKTKQISNKHVEYWISVNGEQLKSIPQKDIRKAPKVIRLKWWELNSKGPTKGKNDRSVQYVDTMFKVVPSRAKSLKEALILKESEDNILHQYSNRDVGARIRKRLIRQIGKHEKIKGLFSINMTHQTVRYHVWKLHKVTSGIVDNVDLDVIKKSRVYQDIYNYIKSINGILGSLEPIYEKQIEFLLHEDDVKYFEYVGFERELVSEIKKQTDKLMNRYRDIKGLLAMIYNEIKAQVSSFVRNPRAMRKYVFGVVLLVIGIVMSELSSDFLPEYRTFTKLFISMMALVPTVVVGNSIYQAIRSFYKGCFS